MSRKRPRAWIAIDTALAEQGVAKKQLLADLEKDLGMPRSTYFWHQSAGWFDRTSANYIAKRLGLPISMLVREEDASSVVDDTISRDAYRVFREALKSRKAKLDIGRESAAFSAWFRQCTESGRVDSAVLDLWLDSIISR